MNKEAADVFHSDDYQKARVWWGDELSHNEQRRFAKKHLDPYQVEMLLGSTAIYTSKKTWFELVIAVWKKETNNNQYSIGGL